MGNISCSVCDPLWLSTVHIQGFCCKQKQEHKKAIFEWRYTSGEHLQTNKNPGPNKRHQTCHLWKGFVRLLNCCCYCNILVRMWVHFVLGFWCVLRTTPSMMSQPLSTEPLSQYEVYSMLLDFRPFWEVLAIIVPCSYCNIIITHPAIVDSFLFIGLFKMASNSVEAMFIFVLALSQYSVRHEQTESVVLSILFYVFTRSIYHNIYPVLAVCSYWVSVCLYKS